MGNGSFLLFMAGGLAFIGAIYSFIGGFRELRLDRKISSHGVLIKGNLTDTRLKSLNSRSLFRKSVCIVYYMYEINGKTYEGKQEIESETILAVTRSANVDIRYLPEKPGRSRLSAGHSTVGRKFGIGVFYFVMFILALALFIGASVK